MQIWSYTDRDSYTDRGVTLIRSYTDRVSYTDRQAGRKAGRE